MVSHAANENFVDLEIHVFQRRDEGYPVQMILDGQQEFPQGYLSADILSWMPAADLAADGQRLFGTLFADGVLRSAWNQACGRTDWAAKGQFFAQVGVALRDRRCWALFATREDSWQVWIRICG